MNNIQEVDGVKVVRWEPATTGIGLQFQKVEKLILADGRELYGCTFPGCTMTGQAALPIAGNHYTSKHLKAPDSWDKLALMPIGELLDRAGKYEERVAHLEAQVAEYRGKYKDAAYELELTKGKLNRREATIASGKINSDADLAEQVVQLTKERDEYQNMAEEAVSLADTYKAQAEALKGTLVAFGFKPPQTGGN